MNDSEETNQDLEVMYMFMLLVTAMHRMGKSDEEIFAVVKGVENEDAIIKNMTVDELDKLLKLQEKLYDRYISWCVNRELGHLC